jgi:hypothetical protein
MAGNGRSYSATRFLLELDGQLAATLSDAEGGELFADVISEPPSGGRVKKHLGPVRCAPVTIAFAAGMGKPLFEWISAALAGKEATHDGALVFLDYRSTAQARLEFTAARITDVVTPAYIATSKEPTRWEVVLEPQTAKLSRATLGTFHPIQASKAAKSWLACNFQLAISGLESACQKVSAVESIRVHVPAEPGTAPNVGNLAITVSNTALEPFETWHEDFVVKGNNGDEFERSATILQRSVDLKDTLCAVALQNVGIIRILPDRAEGTSDVVARSRIELYVEAVELASAALASFTAPPTKDVATQGETDVPYPRGAELAARLRSTEKGFRVVDDRPPRQREGDEAGEAWARRTASLEELESIAALSGEWTELRLSEDHSLGRTLAESGALVADAGAVELTRDEYVEALVAGATRVYREALPHLERGGGENGITAQAADERLAATGAALSGVLRTRDDAANGVIERIR